MDPSSSLDIMTIHQLADATGVPPRRIRHFVAEGLLSPPHGRGRAAHYGREHVERLRQIQALRDANLGLEEIRERLGDPNAVALEGGLPETWQRWVIVPGIELQARTDLDAERATLARMLVRVARQLIDDMGRTG